MTLKTYTKEKPQIVLRTGVFFLDAIKLFSKDSIYFNSGNPTPTEITDFYKDWGRYFVGSQKFGISAEFWMGAVGIEGNLNLLIPPAKKDIDILGYSRGKGEWDWWGFLSCITVPEGNYTTSLIISFMHESYFDRSQDIINNFKCDAADDPSLLATHFSTDTSSIEDAWGELWKIFKKDLSAEVANESFNGLQLNF
jgi:hypothetical protein